MPARAAEPLAPLPEPMRALSGASVQAKSFRFAGNNLLSSARLAPAVAPFLNRPLDFSELQNAAVAAAYRQAGWVVRVYLPQQDITDGTVTIQVVEGRFGTVRFEGQPGRVIAGAAAGHRRQRPARRHPRQRRRTRPRAAADRRPVGRGGERAPGRRRAAGPDRPAAPLGLGDQASALLLHSEGSDYARAAYALPLGNSGLRVGLNASQLSYQVITPEFAALDAHGSSSTAGVDASYPLLRSRRRNLYLAATFDHKRFDNQSAGITASHYWLQVASLGLNGSLFDDYNGGGASTATTRWCCRR